MHNFFIDQGGHGCLSFIKNNHFQTLQHIAYHYFITIMSRVCDETRILLTLTLKSRAYYMLYVWILTSASSQAITWTSAGLVSYWILDTNFIAIFSEIHTFSFQKIYFNMFAHLWSTIHLRVTMVADAKDYYIITYTEANTNSTTNNNRYHLQSLTAGFMGSCWPHEPCYLRLVVKEPFF